MYHALQQPPTPFRLVLSCPSPQVREPHPNSEGRSWWVNSPLRTTGYARNPAVLGTNKHYANAKPIEYFKL